MCKKLIFKIFFCLTKFSLLTHGLDLGLNLKKRTSVKNFFEADFVITRVKPFRKVNFQLCTNCLGSWRSTSHMCTVQKLNFALVILLDLYHFQVCTKVTQITLNLLWL